MERWLVLMTAGKSMKNRELQKKILCSLLAAGVMSVCISGGDVLAAAVTEKIELSGAAASTSYDNLDLQVSDKGSFKGIYTHNGANLDFTGAVTDININTQDNVATAVANYGNNGGVMNFDANKTNIILEHTGAIGQGSRNMGLLVNQGTVNFNGATSIILSTDNTQTIYGVNVECNTADAAKSIVNFNKDAVIEVKTGDLATGIYVSGKPGSVIAAGDSLKINIKADGHINGVYARCGGTFTTAEKTNLNIDLQSEGLYNKVTGIKCLSEKEGNDDPNGGNIDIKGSATININSKKTAYGILNEYYKSPVEPGEVKVAGDLNMTIVGKDVYGILADNKDSDTNVFGNVDIDVSGQTSAFAVQAKEGAKINLGSAGKNVTLTAEATEGKSGNLTAAGIYALNGGNVTVDGAAAKITAKVAKTGRAIGVRVEGKDSSTASTVTLNSDSTEIAVSGTTTDNNFNEGVWVKNGNLTANGKELKITGAVSGYTLEGLNVSTNGIIELNTDKTVIDISDNYGVTGITAHNGGTLKVNKGDLIITSTNTAANGIGKTNSIGIQSDEIGSGEAENTVIIGSGVNKVDITVNGAGSEGSTPNASNGTAGIYDVDGNISIDAEILNVNVTSGSNVSQISGVYSNATGIKGLNGAIKVGAGTETTITATDGYQDATGVYAGAYNNKQAEISILGNTTITAIGKTASYALYAEDGGKITVGSAGKTVSLTGDVVATGVGVVTLAGDTNIVKGTVTADGGSIVLNGSKNAAYAVDKFVTESSGKITVSGGTLNIDNIGDTNKFDLADNSLEVTGKGVLSSESKNVFDAEGSAASKVADAVDAKVLFSGGKLAISDDNYTLEDSKAYSNALGKADNSAAKTTLVMTGTLQQEDIPNNTAGVEDLAPTGAVHTQVTGTVSDSTLHIGGSGTPDIGTTAVNNDLGVKDLQFSGSNIDATVNISNDNGLTLVGDGSGDLLKGTNGSNNTVTVGSTESSGSAGTLTLGNAAAANSGGSLNAAVKVQADSQMKVEAGSFTVKKIEADQGTVAVNEGAALKTAELTIGTSTCDPGTSTAGAVQAAGSVEVDKLTVNKGTVVVTGSLKADALTASSDTSIAVGASESAGTLTAQKVKLNGGSIVLDPAWKDGSTIATASKAGLEFAGAVDGKLTVGQNSVLSLGTTDTAKAEAAFAATGLTWGEKDITAALYIDAAQTLDNSNGGLKVDGTLTHGSSSGFVEANTAAFAAQSLLMVSKAAASAADGALKATSGTLTVADGAKLYIADAEADSTYTVASGFDNGSSVNGWNGENLLLNKLVKATAESGFSSGSYTVKTEKVKAGEALPGVALPNILDAMRSDTDSENAGIKYLSNAISDLNSDVQATAAVNTFAQGAENSGASHSSVLAAFDIGSVVQGHLSLANKGSESDGGFGKAAADRENNGGIWAQYLHNKDKSDAGYEGQYNGFVLGGDFADKGKYSSGVAFSYGSGDSTGSASKNDYDFWGLSYYGGIRNNDTNLIFDVGYSKNSSEIKGVVNADPDTQILTLGVKGEKMYANGHGTKFVPYAGLRYMNVDTDSYTGTIDGKAAANYSPDKADLWLLPVGISITHESVTNNGWKVRPTADIAYVWTMGDNDNVMGITVPGINAQDRLGYELMDSGFFVGSLGLEAENGDWTYGVSYSYQKGSDAQSSKWFVDVKYSF